jgi:PEP-CTERM motif
MKRIIPALVAAVIATVGANSAAQAAVIDFSAVALCPATCTGVSYTGANLGLSTAIDLDASTWIVALVKPADASGLASGDPITIDPHAFSFGTINGSVDFTLATPLVKAWDGANGHFTETLDTLTEVLRGVNQIGFTLTGSITGGTFAGSPASMVINFTQAGGPGNVVSASLTNTSSVPEPATWVMMGLGFAALGYAAVRRSSKDRAAVAMI